MQYKRWDIQGDRMHPECAKNEQTLEGKGTSCITRLGFRNKPCKFTEIFLFRKFTELEGMASIKFLEVLRDHYQTGSKEYKSVQTNTKAAQISWYDSDHQGGKNVPLKWMCACLWNSCLEVVENLRFILLAQYEAKKMGRSSTRFEQSGYTVREALQEGSCCI